MMLKRVVLDSSVRDKARFPTSDRFEADLTELELRDVKEIKLVYASVPPEPHVAVGRDKLHVRSDGVDFVVAIRRGRYAAARTLASQVSVQLQQAVTNASMSAIYYGAGIKITSDKPFSLLEGPDNVARVLGFVAPGSSTLEVASHVLYSASQPLDSSDGSDSVAVVRIDGVSGIRSNSEVMDRAFAVLHDGRVTDPTTMYGANPSEPYVRKLSVRILRRDGSDYDTGGRDVAFHLDVTISPERR
jgi:hypothetical protein